MTTTQSRRRQPPTSHRRRERPKPSRKSTILVSLVILLALLSIPAVGYYVVFIQPLQETVVRVNDTTFDLGYYIERLRIQARQSELTSQSVDMSTEPFRLLDTLRDDELIRQYAIKFGINITPEQIEEELRFQLQPPKGENEQISTEELDREFRELYRKRLSDLKVSDQEYRGLIRASLMREVMKDRLSDRVPTVAEQVRARVITVENEQQLAEVDKRLDAGEDFGQVAAALSKDEATNRNGGDLGWLPQRVMDRPFDDHVFKLDVGGISDPFYMPRGAQETQDRVWLVQVTDRAEARQVEPQAREQLKQRALEDWLEEQRNANVVERHFDSEKYEFAIRKVAEYSQPKPEAAGQS